jgi:ADP-ribose pyrophosphatase YjhB (NUDIX family)
MGGEMFRDGSGRTLADYPRPSVAVDTALLTLDRALGLVVLEVRRPTGRGWALPGTFLHERERLADAVNRALWDKAHIRGLRPRQLQVFDDPGRDDRGWVLSVAHIQVAHVSRLEDRFQDSTRLVPVTRPGRLPFDHAEIVESAVRHIRSQYSDEPDPDHLLGDSFTLRELRLAHEAVMGRELQRDTFRRTMEPRLVATGETTAGGRGRPAEVFRRAAGES